MFGVTFALLDPDPDTDPGTPLNPDPIRIRIPITAGKHRGVCVGTSEGVESCWAASQASILGWKCAYL
jgi:hypothetical protein